MYDFGIRNALTGYRPAFRSGAICPGCGGSNWIVGRSSAECGYCATALPLAPVETAPAKPLRDPAWSNRV